MSAVLSVALTNYMDLLPHVAFMRLATITNWAYGATVALTIAAGVTMVLASNSLEQEREAMEQRYRLDNAAERVTDDVYSLTDKARQYLDSGDTTYLVAYRSEATHLRSVDDRIALVARAGASPDELEILKNAVQLADTLQDEQGAAIKEFLKGDKVRARALLFGPEFERQLDRVELQLQRFRDRLDNRVEQEVASTAYVARIWKAISEAVVGLTALLFLCVLYFVFKQRVLRPVVKLSDVIGRLAAQDYEVEPPDVDQIDEIGDMAHAIWIFRENGMERQRLEVQREADQALRDLLSSMTQRMQGCESRDDLKQVIQRFVPQIVPSRPGALYLLDDNRNAVVEACSWLEPSYSRSEFPPTSCWALRRGAKHAPTGKVIDVPCGHIEFTTDIPPATLCLPLVAQSETLGLLYFEPADADARETPESVIAMLAENISLALANFRLRDTLRDLAMADPLTGLANRRQLDLVLDEQLDLAHRNGKPLGCLMIDVDHFKRFNDEFGHDAGDAVLSEVAALLKGSAREPQLAFRYGGEEFTILLPGVGPELAAARAEDIRSRIADLRVSIGHRELGAISVSIGVACAPELCRFSKLMETADKALLAAKANGRNQIVVASKFDRTDALERRKCA